MDALRPIHGTYRPAAHRTWRAQCAPARGTVRGLTFAKVFTSPLQRATRTCELAGFGAVAEIDRDLVEWNYGDYEGRRTADIHRERPDWELFRDGCPGGESPPRSRRGPIAW